MSHGNADAAEAPNLTKRTLFKNDKPPLFLFSIKHVFTDFISLYKFEDGWKIVGKTFYRHPNS